MWPNLDGPERDVENMAAVLPDFGFTQIHQLTGQKATRAEILAEIDRYIVEEPTLGDTVLFYFAGHGSQRLNSKSAKPDRLDETIVPADAYRGSFDIRDKELARKFNQAIDKGVHVIAIFDSCHSGTMARGAKVGVARWLPYDDRDAIDGGDYGITGAPQSEPPAQRGAIIVSAALSTQTADEVEDQAGKAHGVFTTAFIRALRNSTPAWTTLDLVNSTDALMKADGWTQQATVEGPANRPLFGDFAVTGIHVTILEVVPPDQAVLNAGSSMGFGTGSEFESKSSPGTTLEVTEVSGPASSRARISSGKIDDVHPGDLFQIKRLAVPPEAKLTVFVPGIASTDDWSRIITQVGELQTGNHWSLVSDPVVELPSNLVYWTSVGWMMTVPQGGSVSLGKTLTSDSITRGVQGGAKVYVSVPPTRAMIEALEQQEAITSGAIEFSRSLVASQYILIGRLSHEPNAGSQYALMLPGVFGAFDPANIVRSQIQGKTVVCSTDSELPLRTDWIELGKEHNSMAAAASEIASAALTLGRDRAWLRTGAHNGNGSWPYRLVITESASGQPLKDTPLKEGSQYDVNLVADAAELASHPVQPRYIYLFGLQCDGAGALLYPSAELGGGAPLPLMADDERGMHYPATIELAHLRVAPPVGLDTIILLATAQRISDLGAFSYSGVVTRETERRGLSNELDDLVRGISGQTRGIGAVSATWSIQRSAIKSH